MLLASTEDREAEKHPTIDQQSSHNKELANPKSLHCQGWETLVQRDYDHITAAWEVLLDSLMVTTVHMNWELKGIVTWILFNQANSFQIKAWQWKMLVNS